MSNEQTAKALPAYRIYGVSRDNQGKSVFAEIGSAWANKDGLGLNLYFKARALEGSQIVLRVPSPKKAAPAKSSRRTLGHYDALKPVAEAGAQ
jgi:hypothetical protein